MLLDKGKPRKTCVEVAGRRTFRILTPSQQSVNNINKKIKTNKAHTHTHSTTNTHKMTTIHITTTIHTANQQQLHTRQPKTGKITHETIQNTTCAKGKNTQVIQLHVGKVVPSLSMKAKRRNRFITTFILNVNDTWRRVVSSTSRPSYPRSNSPLCPPIRRPGPPRSLSGRFVEKCPTAARNRTTMPRTFNP
jgi:hypothetical protein